MNAKGQKLTKNMVVDGVDLIQVGGKRFFGKSDCLGMVFLLELGVFCHLGKIAGQILDLL